jgi:hypothetical protein
MIHVNVSENINSVELRHIVAIVVGINGLTRVAQKYRANIQG